MTISARWERDGINSCQLWCGNREARGFWISGPHDGSIDGYYASIDTEFSIHDRLSLPLWKPTLTCLRYGC